MQAKAVEHARLEVMAFIAEIPDPRIRAIAVMRFLEGKSWETTDALREDFASQAAPQVPSW
jgi:hypothetical protein